jgi:site-specific DNA recombinase
MRLGADQEKEWVELRGLEPLTSSMPWKRATSCAKAP